MSENSYKKMSQEDIRMMNYLLVLKILRAQRPTSMAQLASQTKLTLPSISSIISDLEFYGLAKNVGLAPVKRGRFPTLYQFNEDAYHVIGLTIQYNLVSVGLVNLDGKVLEVLSKPLEENRHPDKIVEISVSLIRRLMERSQQQRNILGIGVSMHGIVDPVNGISIYPAQFKWDNFPLAENLKKYLDIPIMMENDINCLLLAEKWFGQGKDMESFVLINVDYGIGAGIMTNGSVLHGADFGSGQIGHIPVSDLGIQCDCGKKGCLETLASERAIFRDIMHEIHHGRTTELLKFVDPNTGRIALEHVYNAEINGDLLAIETIERAGFYLGKGISILVNILNPQNIILTGGILRGMKTLFPVLKETVDSYSLSTNIKNLNITTSHLGPHRDIIGASTLWIEALLTGRIPFGNLVQSK